MAIRTAIWKVGSQPKPLADSSLANEQLMEDMIVAAPHILSDDWMLIGRQEDTGFGGRIDLLAIAPDGSLVLIEIKRDQTPRDVVAQAIDYAYWVEKLSAQDIAAIYDRFTSGGSLANDFEQRFSQPLDLDGLNQNHQIIIVAASLDASTERIVTYLSDRNIPINALCFQVFKNGDEQLLSRAWLLDPMIILPPPPPEKRWNGEFYCSFGIAPSQSWADAMDFGFISSGGGPWYSRTLKLLSPGDRVWVKVPGYGFVGVGRVTGPVQPASTFKVKTEEGEVPVLDVAKRGSYHSEFLEDPERCEYFVPVKWLQTVPLEKAVQETGMFGNQNTVCKPTTPGWPWTVKRLEEKFPNFNRTDKQDDGVKE
jgi:hypothetical protein